MKHPMKHPSPRLTAMVLCAAVALSGCVVYPVHEFHDDDGYRYGQRHHDWRGDRYRDEQSDHDHSHNGRADG